MEDLELIESLAERIERPGAVRAGRHRRAAGASAPCGASATTSCGSIEHGGDPGPSPMMEVAVMADYAPVDLAPEQVAVRAQRPPGHGARRARCWSTPRAPHGVEIPIFCYEPRLGAADRRVPHVPGRGRGHARPADGLQHPGAAPTWWCAPTTGRRARRPGRRARVPAESTTRSTARCATRAASARCRTAPSASGPGARRFVEPKRHFPKPLDLSSLIALDRERCIACFRCVRFSQDVAEDGQLIIQERGRAAARSATFTGDAVRGPLHRQRHRPLPGGRADQHPLPLRRAAVGHPRTPPRSAATARWAATRS